jgi:glycosyltransferase involved in cell wall biosynthesis
VLIGAEDGTGYGGPAPGNQSWKNFMLAELSDRLDRERVHFLGRVPHAQMLDAFSIAAAHVYYTYPFVLSWSLVEAMACECLILGSDTAPVRDAITHGVDGVLNDFFDVDALSAAMIRAVTDPDRFALMRQAARESALSGFDQNSIGVPGWIRAVDDILS